MRWGICSASSISHDFLNAMTAVADNNKAVAVAARDLGRARAQADLFGIPRAYGSYEELANDSEVDIVYVGNIQPLHHAAVSFFLNKGFPVLCETTMTMNLKEAEELVALAREKKLFLMEGLWSRFFPVYHRLRELLKAEVIGKVQKVDVKFDLPVVYIPRVTDKSRGGGGVLEFGCYILQFAQLVFGSHHERLEITGELHESGVDKSGRIVLHYAGGERAVLSYSIDADESTAAVIIGDKGRLEIPKFFWCPTSLVLPDGQTEEYPLPTGAPRSFNYPNSEGFAYEIEHVRDCIEKGLTESPLMTLDEVLYAKSIEDAVLAKLGVVFD